ncbi:hypothetical protein C8D83_104174 [Halothiobacillus neapolitanus]|nr:hypothetical protein C8D83_104174 [Halothiobacillus neapolitanus]
MQIPSKSPSFPLLQRGRRARSKKGGCFPSGHFDIPVICRSRESRNPEKSRRWIPAYAGMTGFPSFPHFEKGVQGDLPTQDLRLLLPFGQLLQALGHQLGDVHGRRGINYPVGKHQLIAIRLGNILDCLQYSLLQFAQRLVFL